MNSSQAAEELVKISLDGVEVAAKITGTGIERAIAILFAMAKEQKTAKGKTKLNNMLKSGSNLKIFSLKESELSEFNKFAKQYGVLYAALVDKKQSNKDGLVDVMVREDDAMIVNRIIDRFKLDAYDTVAIKSEIEKDKIEEMLKNANEKGIPIKSNAEEIVDDLIITSKKEETANPNLAKAEKSPLSEPSLEIKNKLGVVSDEKKPSVRKELEQIKEKMKSEEKTIEPQENTSKKFKLKSKNKKKGMIKNVR